MFRAAVGLFGDRGARLVHDLMALLSGQIISKIIVFAAFAYIARAVDPATYGQLEYVVGLAVFFATVIEGGLGPVGVRRIAQDPGALIPVAGTIAGLRLILAALAAPILAGIILAMGYPQQTLLLAALYAASLFGMAWNQEWLLQNFNLMFRIACAQTLRALVFASVVILCVRSASDLVLIGFAEISSVAALVAFYVWTQWTRIAPVRLRFNPRDMIALARDGASVCAANLVWTLQQYAPLVLIAALANSVETAWFAAPQRIILSLLAFSNVYHFNLYPTLSRHYVADRSRYLTTVGATLRVTSVFSLGAGLALVLLATPIVTAVFGARYAPAALPFALLVWALPITLISGHASWALIAARRQNYLLFAQLAGAVTAIGVAAVSIPFIGAAGGAIAIVATALVVLAVANFAAARSIEGFPMPWRAAALGAIALSISSLAWMLNATPALEAIVGIIVYAVLALAINPRLKADIVRIIYAKKDDLSA